jgi:hypothetical protein
MHITLLTIPEDSQRIFLRRITKGYLARTTVQLGCFLPHPLQLFEGGRRGLLGELVNTPLGFSSLEKTHVLLTRRCGSWVAFVLKLPLT